MKKTFHFIVGMPQSGASLLSCILSQNPRFECALPGGILDAIYLLTKAWQEIPEFRSTPNEPGKLAVMRGMLEGFFADSDRPVTFDKSRAWLAHLEMAEAILGHKAKVLVPVRDMREILASFELLWREHSGLYQNGLEKKYYLDFQSVEGRCSRWLGPDSPIGLSYARLEDALQRNFRDRLHFVDYYELTNHPGASLRRIYDFLEEPVFTHDFQHIDQVVSAADPYYDYRHSHKILPGLIPATGRAETILGVLQSKYKGPYAWNLGR